MKCQNCGAKMPKHSLYCEKCGQDVHIVPDFEPEIELNLEQIISGITEDAFENVATKPKKNKNRWKTVAISMIATLLIVVCGVFGILFVQYQSVDYQVAKAKECTDNGLYHEAVQYYGRALELEPDDLTLKFALAEVYFLKNNKIEYEYLLNSIIKDPNVTGEQLESAYGKLIAIYRARDDYQSIHKILLDSNNEQIMVTYQDYIAHAPEFSLSPGYYTSVQPLKISAVGKGKVYYTMDGSDPTEESNAYMAPIILEEGDYLIKACFINENGTCSNVVTAEYHVEIDEIPAPLIGTISGEYNRPTYIEVLEEEADVYYTTDGNNPTTSSALYVAPIPMPLGKSVFRFAKVVDDVMGNVVECTYNLNLDTEYMPQNAQDDVVQYAIDTNKIRDTQGHFEDSEAVYLYNYQYVIDIESSGHYYVIAEILQNSDGSKMRTGNYFAVGVYSGDIFKLQRDGNNNYTLVEIQY